MDSPSKGDIVAAPTPLDVQIISPPVPASEMSDAELGAAAAEAVERHVAMRDSAIESAVRAGELLREARGRCQRAMSSWAAWLQRYWPKSRQTAQRYMALALEVSQLSGPRAGGNLLGLPSVRAALTDVGYDAGGTRDDSSDPEEQEAKNERTIERLAADAETPGRPTASPRSAAPGGRRPEDKSAAEKARQITAASDAAKWRAQVEEASRRDNITAHEPEPPAEPPPERRKPVSVSGEWLSIADDMEDMHRRAALLVSRVAAVEFFPLPVFMDGGQMPDAREVERAEIAKAVGLAAKGCEVAAQRWASRARDLASMDAEMVKHEVETRAEEEKQRAKAASKRKGA